MPGDAVSLSSIFEGWDGYNTSLERAIRSRSPEELSFRPAPHMHSLREIASHIALGRVDWFSRMEAPGSAEMAVKAETWTPAAEAATGEQIADWLLESWGMIAGVLKSWTVDDLFTSYHQAYQGKTYAVSHQWVIWRIITHDVQHGGQLTVLLEMQNIHCQDLSDLGGHITEPPLVE